MATPSALEVSASSDWIVVCYTRSCLSVGTDRTCSVKFRCFKALSGSYLARLTNLRESGS